MATTISASFEKLKSNLEITGLQRATTSTRQQNVREVLEKDLSVSDSFLTGSYARSTMIAPLKDADIDIFVVLAPKYFEQNGQGALLEKVRKSLLKTYTTSPRISRNGQAVTVTFSDFVVDVVPAFNRKGGGFLIPDSHSSSWISTDPRVHVEKMAAANAVHNGALVPLIKMMKGWNRSNGYPLVSFYLELLTMEVLTNIRISDFSSGVRFVLDKAREKVKYKIADPVPFGGQINGLQNASTVAAAIAKIDSAYDRAIKAEQLENAGRTPEAVAKWQEIFGTYFPAYG